MENSELITNALNYIRSEIQKNNITIDDIANNAGFSTDYFNRMFLAHTGFNVMEYVRFTRLKKASYLLRTTNKDILNIALECGYEAHESFTRAFKKQYGKTPSCYRESMKGIEVLWGEYHNDTIGARIAHEFTNFKIADSDEAIDFLLEHDAIRHGYEAICFNINGGAALYDGNFLSDGFIWFQEYGERIEGWIFSDYYEKITEYLKTFSDGRFDMAFYTLDDDERVTNLLKKHGVNYGKISCHENRIYRGEPYKITPPQGYSMRELKANDSDILAKYYSTKQDHMTLQFLQTRLDQRDIDNNEEHSVFLFGIFHNDEMIGISYGGLQKAHGFVMNNCIETSFLPKYENDDLYKYAFQFVTNATLQKGAIPFDDIQYEGSLGQRGNFEASDFGYETVTIMYRIEPLLLTSQQ